MVTTTGTDRNTQLAATCEQCNRRVGDDQLRYVFADDDGQPDVLVHEACITRYWERFAGEWGLQVRARLQSQLARLGMRRAVEQVLGGRWEHAG